MIDAPADVPATGTPLAFRRLICVTKGVPPKMADSRKLVAAGDEDTRRFVQQARELRVVAIRPARDRHNRDLTCAKTRKDTVVVFASRISIDAVGITTINASAPPDNSTNRR